MSLKTEMISLTIMSMGVSLRSSLADLWRVAIFSADINYACIYLNIKDNMQSAISNTQSWFIVQLHNSKLVQNTFTSSDV